METTKYTKHTKGEMPERKEAGEGTLMDTVPEGTVGKNGLVSRKHLRKGVKRQRRKPKTLGFVVWQKPLTRIIHQGGWSTEAPALWCVARTRP